MTTHELMTPTIYFDKKFGIDAAKIMPGEYFVTRRDMLIVTVLGSCVSACIRDPVTGIGGMNHFMLPENRQQDPSPLATPARYGTHAMEVLINQLLKAGAKRDRLEAKVFGGGKVLRGFIFSNVGEQNANFVRSFLDLEGIPIKGEDLLDVYPRKVYFFPHTGRVLVKKLRSVHNDTIFQREREYGTRIRQEKFGGEIDLF